MAAFGTVGTIRCIDGQSPVQRLCGGTLFTIQQVSQACELPGPVIMQLVPRTWVHDTGWMYTAEQLIDAVVIAADLRSSRTGEPALSRADIGDLIVCDGCGRIAPLHGEDRTGWRHICEPDRDGSARPDGRDYCPDCHIACPQHHHASADCDRCQGAWQAPVAPRVRGRR